MIPENFDKELIKCIIKTKRELETANRNFNIAEGELIDYYAYQIKANKAKLDYLIKEVKQNNIKLDFLTGMQITTEENEAI